jgi:hypothetical protein
MRERSSTWPRAAPGRRILALGGHELTSRPHDRAVCDGIIGLARRRAAEAGSGRDCGPPRLCLLPTASGDPAEQSARFHNCFADRDCEPSEVSLFRLATRPVVLRDHLLSQDLIYVGGGSLVNLLAIWEAHDIGSILRLAWREGIVLVGHSAGAMCWFEGGITKSWGRPASAAGLGFLPGTLCVHYHSEPERRTAFLAAVGRGMLGGWGIDDHAGLLWEDEWMAGALSFRQGARAYRVAVRDGDVTETPLAARRMRSRPLAGSGDEIAEYRATLRARRGVRRLA